MFSLLNSNLTAQNILWSGIMVMRSDQICNLSQKVSDQKHGIVLKWQGILDGKLENAMVGYTFIPKEHVISTPGAGVMCTFAGAGFWKAISKYVYIDNNQVRGNDGNIGKGTASGVTYNNDETVLAKIIGV